MPARTVRVLYFAGCPSHRPTVELVRHVAAESSVPVEVEEVEVVDAADAAPLRFLGSPTIQVDGLDIEPAARDRTEFAMACRTYPGGSGVPPVDLLRAALTTALACCCHGSKRPQRAQAASDEQGTALSSRTGAAGGVLASAGAVATAVASTWCCWLPPLLIATGASAAGVAGFVEQWRPYLAAGAVVLVGCSFYAGYFRGPRCACPTPKWTRIVGRVAPWIAAVVVATALFFPERVAALIRGPADAQVDGHATTVHRFAIEGMTCEACADTLEHDLAGLAGVARASVDFGTRTAEVHADAASVAADVARAAERHGWRATPR